MMSEYFDHYHRWEPLAEFHFKISDETDEYDEDNYVYCLCSRAFIRDGVKTYYVEKEEGSESDVEVTRDSQEWDEHSHVHFSLDTSYKVKCEKDESASCYCSASHTDNYCSTDEHDPAQLQGTVSHSLQPSDSGADLTYPDCHSDYTAHTHDILEKMEQDFPAPTITECDENYLSENTWEKFWAVNGERLIWASWITKYSDYINPAYLDENSDLLMDDNNIPKQRSVDQIYQEPQDINKKNDEEDSIRERKFSYDSKVNPYKKNKTHANSSDKAEETESQNRDDPWLPLARKRSCSEHDRILSPRTVTGTDSMTNVTKITLSSYDVSSSHVTSESSPTEDYSISSTTSDDQSNDQTKIAIVDENSEHLPSEVLDPDQYWQLLWKKHFGEQYALHYANYLESHTEKCEESQQNDVPVINIPDISNSADKVEEKLEIEHENSEGNSQETPTVIEVLTQVDNIKLEDKNTKFKKRNKKNTNRIIGSVGMLLQTLLKDEQKKKELCDVNEVNEPAESEGGSDKTEMRIETTANTVDGTTNVQQSISNTNLSSYNFHDEDGDDDPPDDKFVVVKRSHEIDEEEAAAVEVTNTFDLMGFCVNPDNMPKGRLIYKKRVARLRPRHKRFGASRKTYFDDEGNPYQAQESQDEREMQTDDERPEAKSDTEEVTHLPDNLKTSNIETVDTKDPNVDSEGAKLTKEAAGVPLPSDMSGSFSSVQENSDEQKGNQVEMTKRRRRPKRHARASGIDDADIPAELRETPKMLKYWKKRHSLFHRFDEGIKLDLESWFSVTPESVAWHIANKFAYDVVIDAFCGAGGNTIQFARTCKKVIAIDIDPVKVDMARHNATVYGVLDRIEFMVGDFFRLAPQLEADMVFLSPPWGGPNYSENYEYDLETMLEPKPASQLMDVARNITTNIALYLPRNSRSDQIISIAKDIGSSVEVEQSYLDKRFVAITAYFYQNNDL